MCKFEPDDDLYRGIRPEWWSHTDNRPTSQAFRDYELSVDWCKYSTSHESFERYKRLFGLSSAALVSISVKDVKDIGQEIKYDPCKVKSENNIAHTLVIGKKTHRISHTLAIKASKIIVDL